MWLHEFFFFFFGFFVVLFVCFFFCFFFFKGIGGLNKIIFLGSVQKKFECDWAKFMYLVLFYPQAR